VSVAPRKRTCSHCQEYWLSARKTPSIQRYFSEANFSLTARTRKNCLSTVEGHFPSLNSICVTGTVLLKTDLFLSRAAVLFRTPFHALAVAERYPSRDIVCVLLIFNKILGTSSLIGLLLSRVIQSSDSSCGSPTPSPVPTSLKSSLTSSATCKLFQLLKSSCEGGIIIVYYCELLFIITDKARASRAGHSAMDR